MTVYLDTSSLVKLYVEEAGSEVVEALVARASSIATSAVAYPETRAGLARRRRERTLTSVALTTIVRGLDADWSTFATIEVSDTLARRAGELADRFDLRGFDAVHLASFELVLERAPDDDVHFSSADERLVRAAKKLGQA